MCLVSIRRLVRRYVRSKLRFESSGPRSVHARNRTFSPAARQRRWSPCQLRRSIVYTSCTYLVSRRRSLLELCSVKLTLI